MNKSVVGKFFFASEKDKPEKTFDFLRNIRLFTWVNSPFDLNGREINIEFKSMPDAISSLIDINYIRKDEDGHRRINVSSITERGIMFYTPYPNGDGFIFIPYHEVKSLSTLSASDIESIKRDVQKMDIQAAERS